VSKRLKKILSCALIGLAAAVVVLGLWRLGLMRRWEYATWAWRAKYFAGPGPATDKIKLILLDQHSLDWGKEEMGLAWPWPREVYVPLIDFCRRGGARAVAFDVLYTEPSSRGVSQDVALGEAIRRSPPFVGAISLSRKKSGSSVWPPDYSDRGIAIEGVNSWLENPELEESLVYPWATFPIPEVGLNSVILGNVTEEPDPDSIFRQAALFSLFKGSAVPLLGCGAYLAPQRGSDTPISVKAGVLRIGEKTIPLDKSGRAILRFRGKTELYDPVTAAAVIQSELRIQEGGEAPLDPEIFRDCYVFFGFSAPGLLDLRATPLSPVAPGVLIHATVLDNLLSEDFIQVVPLSLIIIGIVFFSIIAGAALSLVKKAWQTVVVSLVLLPIPWLIGFAAYPAGFWWPIIASEVALALSLVGTLVYNYATEGKQKAFIKQAFKHYLSSDVIDRLINDPSQLQLGGERRELTILFSDLQGFSSISEHMSPVELTTLLNDYLSDMTDIIMEEGGTLDKYEGDAILAFWNAPLSQDDHAGRACRAAIRCQRKLQARRAEFRERTGAELYQRIGINTGEVVVGNMGSRERFDYTVLGDAANLASRLEGANKAFGTYLMVSEETWSQTSGNFVGRELGKLRVVGRKTQVTVFEPWGLKGESLPAGWKEFAEGVGFCYQREWNKALSVFEQLTDDPAAQVYATRCRHIIDTPGSSWDGIWNLTQK
jgi:adenylate cyclase